MMFFRILLVSISLLSCLAARNFNQLLEAQKGLQRRYENAQVARIEVQDVNQFKDLEKHFGEFEFYREEPKKFGDVVDIFVFPKSRDTTLSVFRRLRLSHEVVIENMQTLLDAEAARVRSHRMSREEILSKAEFQAISLKNKQHLESTMYGVESKYEGVAPGFDLKYYEDYRTVEETYAKLESFTILHPKVASVEEIGRTYYDNPIKMLKISKKSKEEKKIMLVDCLIHAREWITGPTCIFLAESLLTGYETKDARILNILDRFDVYIVPIVNVDTYILTYTTTNFRFARKSQTPYYLADPDCVFNALDNTILYAGEDMNRNFPTSNWTRGLGTSDRCWSFVFRGAFPKSSTRVFVDLMHRLQENGNFVAYFNMHSYGEEIYVKDLPSSDVVKAFTAFSDGVKSVNGTEYDILESSDPNPIDGLAFEYANDIAVKYSTLIELPPDFPNDLGGRESFNPTPEKIIPVCLETVEGFMMFLETVIKIDNIPSVFETESTSDETDSTIDSDIHADSASDLHSIGTKDAENNTLLALMVMMLSFTVLILLATIVCMRQGRVEKKAIQNEGNTEVIIGV